MINKDVKKAWVSLMHAIILHAIYDLTPVTHPDSWQAIDFIKGDYCKEMCENINLDYGSVVRRAKEIVISNGGVWE